ncbi:MAG: DUF1232 domain-containing protein, partial [Actinobacteria bacterium]|nr:DUF1232 domain-containing protein [Actinomycetota bacterium]
MNADPDDQLDAEDAVRPDEVLTSEEAARRGGSGAVQGTPAWQELLRFLPDVAKLLSRVAKDRRVPWHAKLVAGGAIAYVVSPVDLIPDVLGGIGQMDDIYVVTKALRYLFNTAGYDLLREHWSGSDDGFTLLLVVAG